MPRKSAAVTAAAKGAARAKAMPAKAAKSAAKPALKAARPQPARAPARTSVKTAVKTAARSLAAPAVKRSARKAPAAPPRDTGAAARPVLVRDSFTMPEQEYAVLADVKQACLRAGIDVKKSELLRIGVALLGQVDIATLKSVLAALPQLKTGRPPAAP
ncbi:hypothetical protein [Massilia sp. 9I]|uniref:hypothetical protein n=1 Tax=Massilia sp. 9I TaxID=2653152 RepID=UPI0012F3A224|nr:hypothetical protein [Massilia sp. 9I]VXA95354.1 conserved hypothetical protein [Massilia sp. 9I]